MRVSLFRAWGFTVDGVLEVVLLGLLLVSAAEEASEGVLDRFKVEG